MRYSKEKTLITGLWCWELTCVRIHTHTHIHVWVRIRNTSAEWRKKNIKWIWDLLLLRSVKINNSHHQNSNNFFFRLWSKLRTIDQNTIRKIKKNTRKINHDWPSKPSLQKKKLQRNAETGATRLLPSSTLISQYEKRNVSNKRTHGDIFTCLANQHEQSTVHSKPT